MLKLQQFLKEYFDKKYEEFARVLKKDKGEKEAFLTAFLAGYSFSPDITLDLDDNILKVTNLHRSLPCRLKEFLDYWKR